LLGEVQNRVNLPRALVAQIRTAPPPIDPTPLIKSSMMRGVASAFSRWIVSGHLTEPARSYGHVRKDRLAGASLAPFPMPWRSLR